MIPSCKLIAGRIDQNCGVHSTVKSNVPVEGEVFSIVVLLLHQLRQCNLQQVIQTNVAGAPLLQYCSLQFVSSRL